MKWFTDASSCGLEIVLDSIGAAVNNPGYFSAHMSKGPNTDEIIEQLTTLTMPGPNDEWKPIIEAWDALLQLQSTVCGMARERKDGVESALSAALSMTKYGVLDARLLKDVVHAILGSGNSVSPEQYLRDRAYEHLCLPGLNLPELDELEPDSRTFNSVLPSFAASTYDYGPLGRTLLWKGACQLFSGPRSTERSETLRSVIFNFPNPPKPGKETLTQFREFVMATDALGVDEPVDIAGHDR